MDYAIYDARRAGFDKVVFVIRPDLETHFRERIEQLREWIPSEYAFQRLDDIPPSATASSSRIKPWGTGHAVLAARAGVSDSSIESIRTWKTPDGLTGHEATVARFVHEMLRDKHVADGTYAAAQSLFGDRGVVDLTLTVSYYSALALAQIALDLEMGPGRVSTL